MKDKTVLKIREARVISGWTDNDDEGHPTSEARLFVQATGIHHTKIGALLQAAPELLAQLQALTVQIEAAGLIVPLKVRAAISSAMEELKS